MGTNLVIDIFPQKCYYDLNATCVLSLYSQSDIVYSLLWGTAMDKKKAGIIALAILGFVVLVIGVPLGINASYQSDIVIIRTQWDAEDVLGYYGTILSAVVTITGLAITIWFTKKQIQRESYLEIEGDKWAKTEMVVADILNEINPMSTLKQVMDTGFTDPSKAISSLLFKNIR